MTVTTTYTADELLIRTLPNTDATSQSDTVSLGNGGFATVGDSSGGLLPVIFYDATGNVAGGDSIGFHGIGGSLARLTNGNVVLAATDVSGGVFYALRSPTGGAISGGTLTSYSGESDVDVAALAGGGFVVVDEAAITGSDHDIGVYVRTSTGAGVTVFAVDSSGDDDENASVAGLADGGFVVTWTRTTSGNNAVWYAVYEANGTVRKAATLLDTAGAINNDPAVTAQGSGFVITYEDTDYADPNRDITYARFDSVGDLQNFARASSLSGEDSQSAVTTLSSGLVLTTFTDNFNDSGDLDIRASVVDPTTDLVFGDVGAPLSLETSGTSDETLSSVSALGLSQFVVSFTDSNGGAVKTETFQLKRFSVGDGAADTIVGDDAVDYMAGGGGNDTLSGGLNFDAAGGYGTRSSYTITRSGGHATVSGGTTGTDTLTSIEKLQFGDGIQLYLTQGSGSRDFNGDVKGDVLLQNISGQAAVWLMNGATKLSAANVGTNPGSTWHEKSSGDFDGDGKGDILWQNTSGQAAVWIMNGVTKVSAANAGPNPGTTWQVIAGADFDGDNKSDILWQNTSGQASIWIMNGATRTAAATIGASPGTAWHEKAAGDFNGDGMADILWQNDSGQAAVWLMNGVTKASAANVGSNPGSTWQVKGSGDFNGDGKADILFQNTNGQAAVWLMNGTTKLSAANVGSNPGTTWHVIGAQDLDSDGKSDIIWQNDSGQASVWFMNGTTKLSAANVGSNPGASWHVITG